MSDIRPALAEKWEQPNPTTYIFYLRKGVKFHNGRELTAEDIKTNIEWRSKEAPKDWPRMRNLEAMSKIKNVEILDRYKIKITWLRWPSKRSSAPPWGLSPATSRASSIIS